MRNGISICIIFGMTLGASASEQWWKHFNDEHLNRYIEQSFKNNGDVASINEKVNQADAQAGQSRSSLYPSLVATGSLTMVPGDAMSSQLPPGTPLPDNITTGGAYISARYKLDSWGSSFQKSRAASYQHKALTEESKSVELKMSSAVAITYFDLLYRKELLTIMQSQIESSKEILELTRRRYRTGAVSLLQVLQQEQALAGREAQVPAMEEGLLSAQLRLSTLTSSQNIVAIPKATLPQVIELALTSDEKIVMQRPDIKAEAMRLQVAEHTHSAALLAHLPSLELMGKAGYDYRDINSIEIDQTWSVGASVSFPLFTGLSAYKGHVGTGAGLRSAEHTLRQKITSAKADLLLQRNKELQQIKAYTAWKKNEIAARTAFNEAKKQYIHGLSSYLDLLNSLNALTQAEINLLNAHMMVLTAQVQHIEMRGGKL